MLLIIILKTILRIPMLSARRVPQQHLGDGVCSTIVAMFITLPRNRLLDTPVKLLQQQRGPPQVIRHAVGRYILKSQTALDSR